MTDADIGFFFFYCKPMIHDVIYYGFELIEISDLYDVGEKKQ